MTAKIEVDDVVPAGVRDCGRDVEGIAVDLPVRPYREAAAKLLQDRLRGEGAKIGEEAAVAVELTRRSSGVPSAAWVANQPIFSSVYTV